LLRCSLIVCTTLLISSAPASANAFYHYEGAPFTYFVNATPPAGSYSSEDRISFFVEFPEPLAPNLAANVASSVLSSSITDGRNTFNHIPAGFSIWTNAAGEIIEWTIDFTTEGFLPLGAVGDQGTTIFSFHRGTSGFDDAKLLQCTASFYPGTCSQALFDQGQVLQPGIWTLIPEPSTALLLATGLLGLAVQRRRCSDQPTHCPRAGSPFHPAPPV
jgi:hypothetical protein